jgi:hypothetical protein
MSKIFLQVLSRSLGIYAMTSKALSKPRRDTVLEPIHRTARPYSRFRGQTQHPVQQPRFLLDSPRPSAPKVLVQRQLLTSNKELLPSGHPLSVPLPLASLLPLVSLPFPSLLSAAQLRMVEGFLLLLDQDHQLSQPPRPIQLPLLDQFSDSLHLAVLVADRNQDNQHSAPPTLPRQLQPSRGPVPLAQHQGPDLGKRLLSVVTHPPPLGNLHPLQLQHSPKHLRQPPLHRRQRHSASLRQIPQHSVNRRRYLVSLPPLPLLVKKPQPLLLVNQTLPSVPQHQPHSQPLDKLCRQYHRAAPRMRPNLMQNPLPPISQMRSRRSGQA